MKFIVLVAVGLLPVRKDILLGEHTASSTACETGTVGLRGGEPGQQTASTGETGMLQQQHS